MTVYDQFLERICPWTKSCKIMQMSAKSFEAVRDWPAPRSVSDIRRFLGLTNFLTHAPTIEVGRYMH